jgi:glutamine synthetase
MAKYKLEYIWLDGYEPIANIRGKTLIKDFDSFPTLEQVPNWGFDGSSTKQAEGRASDCVLKPVGVSPDATKTNAAIVMSEVLLSDSTQYQTNSSATISTIRIQFGFEQEYFLYKDGRPLGFPKRDILRHKENTTPAWATKPSGCRARDCGQASRSVSLRRRQSRRNQCGGRQGSVGIPDLRQGLEEGGGRCMGRSLSHGSPR